MLHIVHRIVPSNIQGYSIKFEFFIKYISNYDPFLKKKAHLYTFFLKLNIFFIWKNIY